VLGSKLMSRQIEQLEHVGGGGGGGIDNFALMKRTMSVFGPKDVRDSHTRARRAAEQSGSSVTSTDRKRGACGGGRSDSHSDED